MRKAPSTTPGTYQALRKLFSLSPTDTMSPSPGWGVGEKVCKALSCSPGSWFQKGSFSVAVSMASLGSALPGNRTPHQERWRQVWSHARGLGPARLLPWGWIPLRWGAAPILYHSDFKSAYCRGCSRPPCGENSCVAKGLARCPLPTFHHSAVPPSLSPAICPIHKTVAASLASGEGTGRSPWPQGPRARGLPPWPSLPLGPVWVKGTRWRLLRLCAPPQPHLYPGQAGGPLPLSSLPLALGAHL